MTAALVAAWIAADDATGGDGACLVCAPSNVAADELLDALSAHGALDPDDDDGSVNDDQYQRHDDRRGGGHGGVTPLVRLGHSARVRSPLQALTLDGAVERAVARAARAEEEEEEEGEGVAERPWLDARRAGGRGSRRAALRGAWTAEGGAAAALAARLNHARARAARLEQAYGEAATSDDYDDEFGWDGDDDDIVWEGSADENHRGYGSDKDDGTSPVSFTAAREATRRATRQQAALLHGWTAARDDARDAQRALEVPGCVVFNTPGQ